MKKLLIYVLTASTCVACSLSPEKQVAKFFAESIDETEIRNDISKIESIAPDHQFGTQGNEDLTDFYTYLLVSKAHVKSDNISFQEVSDSTGSSRNIIAKVKGKRKNNNEILITASVMDIPAAISAINILKHYKACKAPKQNSILLVLYQESQDSTIGLHKFAREYNREEDRFLFNMDISSGSSANDTFTIAEPETIFDEFIKFIPEYFKPYGDYSFQKGEMFDSKWPVKTSRYSYSVDINNIAPDISAVTSLLYLMN